MKNHHIPFNISVLASNEIASVFFPKATAVEEKSHALLVLLMVTHSWQAPWPVSFEDIHNSATTLMTPDFQESLAKMCSEISFKNKKHSKKITEEAVKSTFEFCENVRIGVFKEMSVARTSNCVKKVINALDSYLNTDSADNNEKAQKIKAVLKNEAASKHGSEGAEALILIPQEGGKPPKSVTPQDFLAHIKKLIDGQFNGEPSELAGESEGGVMSNDETSQVKIYSPKEAYDFLQKNAASQSGADDNAKQKRYAAEMVRGTGFKRRDQFKNLNALNSLYERFPHFKEVLDFIKKSLALAACGEEGTPSKMPPILLRGEPGTGKTYFAKELASALSTTFFDKDLSITSEAFVLSGLDPSWKAAKPGIIFESLILGQSANPVICLDEIDKCKETGFNSSPLSALYSLLEPNSAKSFKDEFLPITIDASHINWVLTANKGNIPEPILSRLEVFEIPNPTKEQSMQIAKSVWHSIYNEVLPKGHGFDFELPADVCEFMGSISPRVMRKALTYAASAAALDARKQLSLGDLKDSATRYNPDSKKGKIGFVQ